MQLNGNSFMSFLYKKKEVDRHIEIVVRVSGTSISESIRVSGTSVSPNCRYHAVVGVAVVDSSVHA